MRELRDIKLDEVLEELYGLREENQSLRLDNDFLQKELQRVTSLGMFQFANEFCNDTQLEDAGHELAKSLLGGA